ncbi:hypothetical protein LCGC14_0282550 [marine sediment metagenome]|uniref:Uncharacterized protein n=1 Tax=marine sediment metagenome TaxID=412755 RepID=A0A0F9WGQ7_9ZZZZ
MSQGKARIVDVKPAGPDHQVISFVSEAGSQRRYCKKPCADCPWRLDAVGEFPAEAFKHGAHTAYDMSENTFACHSAGKDKSATCAGYLLHGSYHSLAIRFDLMLGNIDLSEVSDGGHELFTSYRAMAEANGVSADDPVLRACRSADD